MNLVISFELNGIHHWPNPPKGCEEFGEPHRHLFKFIVVCPESKSRSLELFAVRKSLMEWVAHLYPESSLLAGGIDFGPSSCEDIATKLKETWRVDRVFVGEEYFLGALA